MIIIFLNPQYRIPEGKILKTKQVDHSDVIIIIIIIIIIIVIVIVIIIIIVVYAYAYRFVSMQWRSQRGEGTIKGPRNSHNFLP